MRRLPRSPFTHPTWSTALLQKKLSSIYSLPLSHLIPMVVIWLLCLNLVSETLTALEDRSYQGPAPSTGLRASTATGSGADSQLSPPAPLPPPPATSPAFPPEVTTSDRLPTLVTPNGQPEAPPIPSPAPTLAPSVINPQEPIPVPSTTPTPIPTPIVIAPPPPTQAVAATLQPTLVAILIPPSTPAPTPTSFLPSPPAQETSPDVDLTLQTDVAKPAVGQLFRVEAGASNPVDTVQVYLDFDPAILQLVEMDAGDTLEVGLESAFDNLTGRVDYAAGTLGDSASAPFTLVSLTFRAVNPTTTAGTQLLFAPLIAPRETKPIEAGANNLGTLNPLTLVIG